MAVYSLYFYPLLKKLYKDTCTYSWTLRTYHLLVTWLLCYNTWTFPFKICLSRVSLYFEIPLSFCSQIATLVCGVHCFAFFCFCFCFKCSYHLESNKHSPIYSFKTLYFFNYLKSILVTEQTFAEPGEYWWARPHGQCFPHSVSWVFQLREALEAVPGEGTIAFWCSLERFVYLLFIYFVVKQ